MDSRFLLTPSRVHATTTQKTPAQSRIIQNKNIQKRLQNLPVSELSRINKNLLKQNEILGSQVKNVKQKLSKLIQQKKLSAQLKSNPQIQEHILKLKKQLQVKYEKMNSLKEHIRRQNEKLTMEQAMTNKKQRVNQVRALQMQIESFQVQKQKFLTDLKGNQVDFQQYLPDNNLFQHIQKYKEENKTIKRKAYDLSVDIRQKQKCAKQTLTKIYSLKRQGEGFNRNIRVKSLSLLNRPELTMGGGEAKHLQQQIQNLKNKKLSIQSQISQDQKNKQVLKQKMLNEGRKFLEYHQRLIKRRTRNLTQVNFLQKKLNQIRLQRQLQLQRANVPVAQRQVQTQNIIRKEYRKDWIGNNEGTPFDDTDLLYFKESCLIKYLLVYRTTDHIVFIRFGYEHQAQRFKYETKVPFDKEYLKKIQNKRIVSKGNGHLVNLTLSITKHIITRIQSFWSDGDNSVQGWQTAESIKYIFDISSKQRPIAFYGTVVPHSKGFYALESLGCQILQNQE